MKKILMALAFASMFSVAFAQSRSGHEGVSGNKYEVVTNKFWSNWFFSAGGGAEMMIGNRDVHGSIGDRISPTLNVALGKWFTPGLGLRLQYSGLQARGYTDDPNNGYISSGADNSGYYKQKFDYMNLHGDVLFNVSALLGGYNSHRIYEFIPYLGAGFTHTYSSPKKESFAINGGIINRFRISPALDLNIEMSIMGTENKFDGERGGKKDFDGVVAATAGFTYYFKKRGFSKPQATRDLISEAELRNMRDRMNELSAENHRLKDELASGPRTVVETEEVIVKTPDITPYSVFFTIGSAKISDQQMVNLGFFADQLKEYPDIRVKIVGYADAATGSKELNQRLSLKRAEAVANALEKTYNIDRHRMTLDAEGGVDKYAKIYLNRVAEVEVVK